jgi:hypothetical protein
MNGKEFMAMAGESRQDPARSPSNRIFLEIAARVPQLM